MKTTTPWQSVELPEFPPLDRDLTVDVVIVGGGITGLTAAYLLAREGKKVCLLERQRLARGDTGCTTAHLTYVTDSRPSQLEGMFGGASSALAWRGGASAIHLIEKIVRTDGVDCDFAHVPGFLLGSLESTHDETKKIESEAQLIQDWGFSPTFIGSVPRLDKPGILIPHQAKFHPQKYLRHLASSAAIFGCRIFEHSDAVEFGENPRFVRANGWKVNCDYIIIATHVPITGESGFVRGTLLQSKLTSSTTYAIGAKIPAGYLAEACFWDTSSPYYYLRVDGGDSHDYAIFGGEDHKTGQESDSVVRFERLEERLSSLIPNIEVDHRWSGQVVETADGLPYIGETSHKQFVATGFSGNGMTWGTLAGMMARDAVLDRHNPWKELLDPARKKIGGLWSFLRNGLDYPYYLFGERLWGHAAESLQSVRNGEGKVLTLNGRQVACCREENGELRSVSAVCPHLGCLVHWNTAEQTWDCPCHGSRFRSTGEVMAGPAESSLAAIDLTETSYLRGEEREDDLRAEETAAWEGMETSRRKQ